MLRWDFYSKEQDDEGTVNKSVGNKFKSLLILRTEDLVSASVISLQQLLQDDFRMIKYDYFHVRIHFNNGSNTLPWGVFQK